MHNLEYISIRCLQHVRQRTAPHIAASVVNAALSVPKWLLKMTRQLPYRHTKTLHHMQVQQISLSSGNSRWPCPTIPHLWGEVS